MIALLGLDKTIIGVKIIHVHSVGLGKAASYSRCEAYLASLTSQERVPGVWSATALGSC